MLCCSNVNVTSSIFLNIRDVFLPFFCGFHSLYLVTFVQSLPPRYFHFWKAMAPKKTQKEHQFHGHFHSRPFLVSFSLVLVLIWICCLSDELSRSSWNTGRILDKEHSKSCLQETTQNVTMMGQLVHFVSLISNKKAWWKVCCCDNFLKRLVTPECSLTVLNLKLHLLLDEMDQNKCNQCKLTSTHKRAT